MSESNNSGYVTIDELAEYLKVKISTIRTWIKLGKLPSDAYLKVSNTYRFNIQEAVAGLKRSSMADMAAEAVAAQNAPIKQRLQDAIVKVRNNKEKTEVPEKTQEMKLGGTSFTATMKNDPEIDQFIGGTR